MNESIVLTEEDYNELTWKGVGPRIRYIRELLYKRYGDDYTSKNVALRIEVISPQALSVIERGETKSCPFHVVVAIAKDFGVDLEIFTDEFYKHGYRNIVISKTRTKIQKRNRVGVMFYEINEKNERRILLQEESSRSISSSFTKFIMETIYNLLSLYGLKNYELNPKQIASVQYEDRNRLEEQFPWIRSNIWNNHFNMMVAETNEQQNQ